VLNCFWKLTLTLANLLSSSFVLFLWIRQSSKSDSLHCSSLKKQHVKTPCMKCNLVMKSVTKFHLRYCFIFRFVCFVIKGVLCAIL
jgi:hypothetical protein